MSSIQDPRPLSAIPRARATHRYFLAFLALRVALFLSLGGAPLVASASIFSALSGILREETASADVVKLSAHNSQNVPLLRAALNIDPNPAKGGGDIAIVGGTALLSEEGPSGTIADIESAHTGQISIYVVHEGDSLAGIAKMFGVSVNTIAWANDLKRGATLVPGQTLVILPISGVKHTVAKGDTLKSIAKKYQADVDEILQYNGLPSDAKLAIGDEVIVPDGEILAPVYSASGAKAKVRGASGPEYLGYYGRPVVGGRKSQGLHGYNGVDIAAPVGTPILAAAAGQVIVSRDYGWNGGYGNYVVIQHDNGTQTLYAHNSSNIVFVGQRVFQGQVVGYVGSTGKSTGAHLHFEVRGAKNPF